MMHLRFDNIPSFMADHNDPIYQLEEKVDQMAELSPMKQTALLYNDANNYVMASLTPFEGWYEKRKTIILEYASLNWIGLSLYLNERRTSLGNRCAMIHQKLQLLKNELDTQKCFQLTVFCSALAQIDGLWHILLPSDYHPLPEDPTVIHLLRYFGL